MTVTLEREYALKAVARVEEVEAIADRNPNPDDARALHILVEDLIRELPPMRPLIAADLLRLSEKTVRAWVSQGVLTPVQEEPRLTLEPSSVIHVARLLKQLRANGRNRNLLNEVYYRLADEQLANSDDFKTSLQQARQGKGRKL